ncbi:MAG: Nramp family divalent metal transporter [Candidatus Binatia bacterium]|nr:Nramp family divalent metal transporter [Candidatus Binatia bacterium]
MAGTSILGVIGPGAIILGTSIGSGEWLLGPAAFVKYGMSLLWVASIAIFLQTVLNTEVIRYTLYTGEPIFTGFMRTRPHATFWAWFYSLFYFLQVGWPAWAGAAAGAIFYLFRGTMASATDAGSVYWIGVGTFLVCVLILLCGTRIERTLELLNWVLIVFILGGLTFLCVCFAPPERWLGAVTGFFGFDRSSGTFRFFPPGADWFLLGAVAAYSGAGGVGNLTLSNWARDKGFGMGQVVGFIPAVVGGQQVFLAHVGSVFRVTPDNLVRWREWWRIVQVDQWGIFFTGAFLGMGLPAILYTSFIQHGQDIRGLAVAVELANAMAARGGTLLGVLVALMGAWMLFKTQLDLLEGMVRAVTDILWTGSQRVRRWSEGDVRLVYYAVLATVVVWGIFALGLAQPIILLQLGANMAGVVFIVSALHTLYVNTHFLPKEIQPPLWRRVALVCTALFYGFFVYLWLMGGPLPDLEKGFLFQLFRSVL